MFSYTFPGNSEEGRQETTTSFCRRKEDTCCDHMFSLTVSVIIHLLISNHINKIVIVIVNQLLLLQTSFKMYLPQLLNSVLLKANTLPYIYLK